MSVRLSKCYCPKVGIVLALTTTSTATVNLSHTPDLFGDMVPNNNLSTLACHSAKRIRGPDIDMTPVGALVLVDGKVCRITRHQNVQVAILVIIRHGAPIMIRTCDGCSICLGTPTHMAGHQAAFFCSALPEWGKCLKNSLKALELPVLRRSS